MSADFNDHSTDAMFATILAEIKAVREDVARVEAQTTKTNGRVTALERDKWYQRGVMAAVAIGASAAWNYLAK